MVGDLVNLNWLKRVFFILFYYLKNIAIDLGKNFSFILPCVYDEAANNLQATFIHMKKDPVINDRSKFIVFEEKLRHFKNKFNDVDGN